MSKSNPTDQNCLALDEELKAKIASALDFSAIYEHIENLEAMHRQTKQAINNIIDNLQTGAFKVIICDDGEERDVTAETIENLKRII